MLQYFNQQCLKFTILKNFKFAILLQKRGFFERKTDLRLMTLTRKIIN